MLILSRKIGESIQIGDSVTIVIKGIKGNQARVGIKAPAGVAVHREEIYQRIQSGIQQSSPDDKDTSLVD